MGSFRVVQRCADDGAHGSVVWGRRAGLRGGKSRGAALFEWIDAGEGRGWREDGEEGEDGLKREARWSFMFDLLFILYHIYTDCLFIKQ